MATFQNPKIPLCEKNDVSIQVILCPLLGLFLGFLPGPKDNFPNEKATTQPVLSEISNANGKIRQTGEADSRKRWLFFKVAVGNGKFSGFWFLDLDGDYYKLRPSQSKNKVWT